MKWYYKVTNPDGIFKWRGPFDDEAAALADKDLSDTEAPELTTEAPFEDADDYGDTQPRPQTRLDLWNGTQVVVYDDGTRVGLPTP
jgi:hypothetical protein